MSGITPTGFVSKTLEEIIADFVAKQREKFGANVNVSSASILGQLNAIYGTGLAELWEVQRAGYYATRRSGSGAGLDQTYRLVGVWRKVGQKSQVALAVTLAAGFTLNAGSVAQVSGNESARFVTLAPVTNGGAVPNTFLVNAEAEFYGPTYGYAGTITVCSSPSASPAGWISVTNPLDATVGSFAEGDVPLRARGDLAIAGQGEGEIDAIRKAVLDVSGVQECVVEDNTNDFAVNGIPAHGIKVVIFDGVSPVASDSAVVAAIWSKLGAGTPTSGADSSTVVDSNGQVRTIYFDRATITDVYAIVLIEKDPSLYPSDGDALIKQEIVSWADANLTIGKKLYASRLKDLAFNIDGVLSVPTVYVGLAPSPTSEADLVPGLLQKLDLDTSRIEVRLA